jgi:hypothetical protein
LKVKQFAKNLGFEPEGTTESEILKKMNIFLATEATKQISARPAMFEFQQNLKANPGLANSLDGTKALINILRQTTLQNIGLGKLAMDEKNAPNWGDVEERFYSDPKNAIRSPFTGAVLGSNGNAAPSAAPAQPAPAKGGHPSATLTAATGSLAATRMIRQAGKLSARPCQFRRCANGRPVGKKIGAASQPPRSPSTQHLQPRSPLT